MRRLLLLSTLLIGFAGCAASATTSAASSPVSVAQAVAPRCAGFSEDAIDAILSPAAIDAVEPAYADASSQAKGSPASFRGARLRIKPIVGFTPQSIARAIDCHEARVTLAQVPARENDPYVLPGVWLVVDVDSDRDSFVVTIRADSPDVARRLLDRARSFAGSRS